MSVGLDIGTSSIKVVELKGRGAGFTLKSAGAVGYNGPQIDPNLADERELANMGQLIKKLCVDAKISSKEVTVSLPETQVFTRVLQFPLLNDQEISSAVKWEAEEYIPIPLADAVIEHQILERREAAVPPQVLVLLIAVLRSLVEKYVQVLEFAGLEVAAVETELMAMVRSLAPQDKTVLLVDFGARSTDIAIAKNGELFLTRSIPVAGEAFTRAVAQGLGVSEAQAEEYKRTYGMMENQLEGKIGRSLAPIMRVVTQEIQKAIHYYQLNLKGEAPLAVVLSGGSAGMPGVSAVLATMLGMEVTIGAPFAKVEVDQEAARNLASFAPLYSIAVGLAMREN